MQTLVLLMALSGIGCQNKPTISGDVPPALPSTAGVPGDVSAQLPGPSPYSAHLSALQTPHHPLEDTGNFWGSLHDTFYSFFCGRSPGIPSAREIEASVYQYDAGY
jgi:hypothetical protein